jgi:hypothetical protein
VGGTVAGEQHASHSAVVADSDHDRLAATTSALEAAGFHVFPATDTDSLALHLQQHHPAVVVAGNSLAHGA